MNYSSTASVHTEQTSSTTNTDTSSFYSSVSSFTANNNNNNNNSNNDDDKSPLLTNSNTTTTTRQQQQHWAPTLTTTTKYSGGSSDYGTTTTSNHSKTTTTTTKRNHDYYHQQHCGYCTIQPDYYGNSHNHDDDDDDDSMFDDNPIDPKVAKFMNQDFKRQHESSSNGWDQGSEHFSAIFKGLANFLAASTGPPQLVMWGFLTWFLTTIIILSRSSFLTTYKPFRDAVVIMLLIGLVLNANAFVAFKHATLSCPMSKVDPTFSMYLQTQPFSIARLFAIPYCVSCYSGVANSAPPGTFVSVFPHRHEILIPVVVASITIPLVLWQLGSLLNHWVYPKETPTQFQQRRHSSIVMINV